MIVMLFEDLERGVMRTIYTNRGHKEKLEPTWMGDSVGHWEGDTLIVDTIGFNTDTWLNDAGAQHSDGSSSGGKNSAGSRWKISGI